MGVTNTVRAAQAVKVAEAAEAVRTAPVMSVESDESVLVQRKDEKDEDYAVRVSAHFDAMPKRVKQVMKGKDVHPSAVHVAFTEAFRQIGGADNAARAAKIAVARDRAGEGMTRLLVEFAVGDAVPVGPGKTGKGDNVGPKRVFAKWGDVAVMAGVAASRVREVADETRVRNLHRQNVSALKEAASEGGVLEDVTDSMVSEWADGDADAVGDVIQSLTDGVVPAIDETRRMDGDALAALVSKVESILNDENVVVDGVNRESVRRAGNTLAMLSKVALSF